MKPAELLPLNCTYSSELLLRGGIEDNLKLIFLILNKNVCCDPSLELSR